MPSGRLDRDDHRLPINASGKGIAAQNLPNEPYLPRLFIVCFMWFIIKPSGAKACPGSHIKKRKAIFQFRNAAQKAQ